MQVTYLCHSRLKKHLSGFVLGSGRRWLFLETITHVPLRKRCWQRHNCHRQKVCRCQSVFTREMEELRAEEQQAAGNKSQGLGTSFVSWSAVIQGHSPCGHHSSIFPASLELEAEAGKPIYMWEPLINTFNTKESPMQRAMGKRRVRGGLSHSLELPGREPWGWDAAPSSTEPTTHCWSPLLS